MANFEIGKMQQAARKRREKHLLMKNKMKNDANKNEKVRMRKLQVNFRNYQPKNKTIKEKKVERIEAPDITGHIQIHLQKENDSLEVDIELYKLEPKKLDYYLKRNIERKLVKLDKRTSKAISEMVRDKLQQSAKKNNSIYTR